jgi:ABC-type multidrug transport system fused ATPase/permease subunit
MVLGTIFAIGNGSVMPIFSVIFGQLLDDFNSPGGISAGINRNAWTFAVLGAGMFVCSWISLGCWMTIAEYQSKRIREAYLRAVMRQDMTFFDTNSPGELTTRLANDTELVKKALGEKVSTGFQHITTFIGGIVIGFYFGWQMALIVIGITPPLGLATSFLAKFMGEASRRNQDAYGKAGSVADETFTNIRTISALGAEEKEVARYTSHLGVARDAGVRRSMLAGLSMAVTNFIMFCSYGLCLWFGVWLIRKRM